MLSVSRPVTERPLGSALIVDDHPLFCDALSITLSALVGIPEVRTAGRLETALALIAHDRPDVVVLDLDLPDVSGLEGLVRLKAALPGVPVVLVSSMAEPRVIRAAFQAGADGYIPKNSQRDRFREAFAAIARGERWAPPGLGAEADGPADRAAEAAARLALLTPQQTRILQMICEGLMNKQIAYHLDIAETTVKAHVTAIMRKLGVVSRTQALLLAQEANLTARLPGD